MPQELIFFGPFVLVICLLLLLDLGVFTSTDKPVSFKNAMAWTTVWVGFAVLFYLLILFKGELIHQIHDMEHLKHIVVKYHHPIDITGSEFVEAISKYRKNLALEYLTGYVIEYSLSIDNIFVIIMIFMSFGVKPQYYKWILFWGIAGAIIMRFVFIFLSAALIVKFHWVLYIFGIFLVITGVVMFLRRNREEKFDPKDHPVVKFASRYLAVFPRNVGRRFFIRNKKGRFYITPLFLVLMVIEFSDVIFAVDSVPAIFSITKDPYIVFFSNIFAIIGLRSLFFIVMNLMNSLKYLKTGLSFLLIVIGAKMLVPHEWLEKIGFTTTTSFILVVAIIAISVIASLIKSGLDKKRELTLK